MKWEDVDMKDKQSLGRFLLDQATAVTAAADNIGKAMMALDLLHGLGVMVGAADGSRMPLLTAWARLCNVIETHGLCVVKTMAEDLVNGEVEHGKVRLTDAGIKAVEDGEELEMPDAAELDQVADEMGAMHKLINDIIMGLGMEDDDGESWKHAN